MSVTPELIVRAVGEIAVGVDDDDPTTALRELEQLVRYGHVMESLRCAVEYVLERLDVPEGHRLDSMAWDTAATRFGAHRALQLVARGVDGAPLGVHTDAITALVHPDIVGQTLLSLLEIGASLDVGSAVVRTVRR